MSVSPRGHVRRDWGDDDDQTPILHVDMDSFFASVEVREQPHLAGKPVVVGGPSARGVVTAATYEARAFGIRAGMPVGQAQAACPEAVFLPVRHDLYRTYSRAVMTIIGNVTPDFEPLSIDEAFLDVSGARRRLGSPVAIAQMIRGRIRAELGLPASVGVAAVKSVAKIASAHAKPDGLLLVPKSRTVEFLHGLPIGALWGVGKRTGEILKTRGVDTVGQLSQVELPVLSQWLGQSHAQALHDLSWGRDDRGVQARPREKSISTERTFETNLLTPGELHAFVLEASHECGRRLRRAGLLAWTVTIKLRDSRFSTLTRSRSLVAPTDVGRQIASAAVTLADSVPFPRGGVRLSGVGVSGLVGDDSGVPVLLDEDPRPRAAEVAMDQARERFGVAALRPASLVRRPAPTPPVRVGRQAPVDST